MNEQPGGPGFHGAIATHAETGRTCPYCRFPLKEGAELAVCVACGAPHHGDCWRDNGGCAVFGCASGPAVGGAGAPGPATVPLQAKGPPPAVHRSASGGTGLPPTVGGGVLPTAGGGVPPAVSGAPPPAAGQPPWPSQQPPSPGWWANWSLAVAVVILALAIAGAAVAIVLTRQGSGGAHEVGSTTTTVTAPASATAAASQASTASTPPSSTAAAGDAPAETQTATTPAGDGELPGVSDQQMQGEIQQMLLAWHEDVVHGEYHAAWELLSHRKQVQDSREDGYGTWAKNQSTLRPYLNPSGLQVSVESTEPSEGVAQVDVTGMSWDKPGAPCTEWSGITWVKYEDGSWKYDPGYSTTPQRERQWKPRFSELLGGQC